MTTDPIFTSLAGIIVLVLFRQMTRGYQGTISARNEKRRLTASGLNNLAVGLILIAISIPLYEKSGLSRPLSFGDLARMVDFAPLPLVALSLHIAARMLLSGIEEP